MQLLPLAVASHTTTSPHPRPHLHLRPPQRHLEGELIQWGCKEVPGRAGAAATALQLQGVDRGAEVGTRAPHLLPHPHQPHHLSQSRSRRRSLSLHTQRCLLLMHHSTAAGAPAEAGRSAGAAGGRTGAAAVTLACPGIRQSPQCRSLWQPRNLPLLCLQSTRQSLRQG